MVVIDMDCMIFDDTGLTCTVNEFTKLDGKLERVPIVDASLKYEFPHLVKTSVILF